MARKKTLPTSIVTRAEVGLIALVVPHRVRHARAGVGVKVLHDLEIEASA
jgi:hypothetical protein